LDRFAVRFLIFHVAVRERAGSSRLDQVAEYSALMLELQQAIHSKSSTVYIVKWWRYNIEMQMWMYLIPLINCYTHSFHTCYCTTVYKFTFWKDFLLLAGLVKLIVDDGKGFRLMGDGSNNGLLHCSVGENLTLLIWMDNFV